MKKEIFQKKWYYRLLQIIFLGCFIISIYPGIWAIFYEDDMPFIGVLWIIIFIIIFWFIKRICYYLLFKKKIISRKNK